MTNDKSSSQNKVLAPEEQNARARIMEVATRLFAQQGLDGTSVRDIAKESGLNLSLISYYFGGKEALYVEIIRNFGLNVSREVNQIVDELNSKELSGESLAQGVAGLINHFCELREVNSYISIIMQREQLEGLPHAKQIFEEIFNPIGTTLIGIMVKAQKAGIVRKDLNPLFFFIILKESVMGFYSVKNCKIDTGITKKYFSDKDIKGFQTQLVSILLKGIFV